eukprot:scaffold1278_cov356-Prasinococcus_capsulatus_cf.AAC.7
MGLFSLWLGTCHTLSLEAIPCDLRTHGLFRVQRRQPALLQQLSRNVIARCYLTERETTTARRISPSAEWPAELMRGQRLLSAKLSRLLRGVQLASKQLLLQG